MSKGTILYIEDNDDNRLLVRRVLESEGYRVVEAEDGPQGFSPSKQTLMELLHPANMGHKFQVLSAFRRQI